MKIHLLSCHAVLEYNLLSLFTEMGHDVFSNGAYLDPNGNSMLPRPGVPKAIHHTDYELLARTTPKTQLPQALIEPFDVIFIMHTPDWVVENWNNIKHKKVIWYSIGQSTKHVENSIRKMRYEGLKIVRYSDMEKNIPEYLGSDAIIPFHQDPNEFGGWNGNEKRVINFSQSLKGRRGFCHHDEIVGVMNSFPSVVYGSGNDDLGGLNGGEIPYEVMKKQYRNNRVFLYGGTWPAPYTLTFQEALMTGIPVVSIGQKLAEEIPSIAQRDQFNFFEVPTIINNGVNGFIGNTVGELREYVHRCLEDWDLAKRVGDEGRRTAISLYGKDTVKGGWTTWLNLL